MSIIKQGESCNIAGGQAQATVTNLDQNKQGSYEITGDGMDINKQIPGGATQNTAINNNPVTVTNSGKPNLNVANCN